jgi:hypothetical protein
VIDDEAQRPVLIDGVAEDDTNTEFLTFITEADAQTSQWCTIWLRPTAEWPQAHVRLQVQTTDGRVILSMPFSVADRAGLRSENP